jgi:hypothetical protein
LAREYNLSEGEARNLLKLDGEEYTRALYTMTMGIDFSGMTDTSAPTDTGDMPAPTDDATGTTVE